MSLYYQFDLYILLSMLFYWTESKPVSEFNNQSNYLNDLFSKQASVNFHEFILGDPAQNSVINIPEVLKGSKVFYLCDKNIPHLNNSKELALAKTYPHILLCLGLSHILTLNSVLLNNVAKSSPIILPFPKNEIELDSLISNFNANETLKNTIMCGQHKVTLPLNETGVVDYVKLVNPYLDTPKTCEKLCLQFDNSINPICALLMQANAVYSQLLELNQQKFNGDIQNVDSAKAQEEGSVVQKTVPNTKEVIDEVVPIKNKEIPSVNTNQVSDLLVENSTASSSTPGEVVLGEKDSNLAKSVESVHEKVTLLNIAVQNSTLLLNTEQTSLNNPVDFVGEQQGVNAINKELNSDENTDDDDDVLQTEKETPLPVVEVKTTQTQPSSTSTKGTLGPAKLPAIDEDNAEEAENDADNSLLQLKHNKKMAQPKGESQTSAVQETSVAQNNKKSKTKSTTTTEKVDDPKVIFDNGDNLGNDQDDVDLDGGGDISPRMGLQESPVETLERDPTNKVVKNQVAADDSFYSSVDHRSYKQGDDAGGAGSLLAEVEENVPYIKMGPTKDRFVEAEDSHFFTYFMLMFVICIVLYLIFYNKRKLLALALEGRHAGGRRVRSRKSTSYSRVSTGFDESKQQLLY